MAKTGNSPDPFEVMRAVLAEPAASVNRLPFLAGLLDEDDAAVRLAGAFGLCLIARADPDVVPYVAGRLFDRLDGENPEAEVAYGYLATKYPRRFDSGFQGDTPDESDRPDEGQSGANASSRDTPLDGVGRVRPPGVEFDPRYVESNRSVIDPADPQRHDDPARAPTGSGSSSTGDAERSIGASDRDAQTRTDRQRWNQLFEALSEILEHSRFDELVMLSGNQRGRYADVARVLTVDEGVERALAMRLFHLPESDELAHFEENLCRALERWQGVDDHPHIATVYDWNSSPSPWAATDLYESTIADRVAAIAPDVAISIGIDVADALAHAHHHGVIHGGLDPQTIGLSGTSADRLGTEVALLNVGLLDVYRFHVTPATCLDPRYAAPEYYDRDFGRIDHATDIYHLGAVLYRLLTGRPPFLGEFEAIREDVMNTAAPEPSLLVDVSGRVDDILTKAMAKRTLRRYETINDLRQDLVRVHETMTGLEGDHERSDRP